MPRERRKLKCRVTGGQAQVAACAPAAGGHGWTVVDKADVDLKVYEHSSPDLAAEERVHPGDCTLMFVIVNPPTGSSPVPDIATLQRAVDELLAPGDGR